MIRAVLIIAALCVPLIMWLNKTDAEAMAACQERHSFDTCFYSLHR